MTGALHFTSKLNLNNELGCENLLERGNMLSLSFFHKINLHETKPFIRTCMPKLDFENTCNTRSIYFQKLFNTKILKNWFGPLHRDSTPQNTNTSVRASNLDILSWQELELVDITLTNINVQ